MPTSFALLGSLSNKQRGNTSHTRTKNVWQVGVWATDHWFLPSFAIATTRTSSSVNKSWEKSRDKISSQWNIRWIRTDNYNGPDRDHGHLMRIASLTGLVHFWCLPLQRETRSASSTPHCSRKHLPPSLHVSASFKPLQQAFGRPITLVFTSRLPTQSTSMILRQILWKISTRQKIQARLDTWLRKTNLRWFLTQETRYMSWNVAQIQRFRKYLKPRKPPSPLCLCQMTILCLLLPPKTPFISIIWPWDPILSCEV